MSDCIKKTAHKNICPVLESVKDIVTEMVEERPLLWAGAVFVIGLLLGRHCLCRSCCKKKCCGSCHEGEEKKK